MRFRTTIELGGKTATGFCAPPEIVATLGPGKRPPVRVTISGHTYRSTVAVMGGRFMVPLSAANRLGAGVAAGDEVEVELELDTEPRIATPPPDLARALKVDAEAGRAFERASYTHQREWIASIEQVETAQTRQRRIAKALQALRGDPG